MKENKITIAIVVIFLVALLLDFIIKNFFIQMILGALIICIGPVGVFYYLSVKKKK